MKLVISLSELQKSLSKILPAIPPKATLPVLEHIHLTLDGNKLYLAATNQDIYVKTEIEVEGIEDGAVLVPARKLNDVVKALGTKNSIELTVNSEYEVSITTSAGKYSMKGLDVNEYVSLPELFEIEKPDYENTQNSESNENSAYITKADMQEISRKPIFAVAKDDFRPAMTGVLFQLRANKITAVATDSFRLVRIIKDYEKENLPNEIDIIIPSQTVELLGKSDNDLVMTTIQNMNKITHIRFDMGNTVVVSKVIDEKYPPYESVIPKNNDKTVIVDKSLLLDAIKRVSIFVNENSKQIILKIHDNNLYVHGQDQDSGFEGNESIICDYSGEEFSTGFNYSNLIDALNHLDTYDNTNKVFMTFSDPIKSALIMADEKGDNQLMLIMPMRISN